MIKEDTRPSEAKVIIVYINFGQNVEVAPKESLLNPDVQEAIVKNLFIAETLIVNILVVYNYLQATIITNEIKVINFYSNGDIIN